MNDKIIRQKQMKLYIDIERIYGKVRENSDIDGIANMLLSYSSCLNWNIQVLDI